MQRISNHPLAVLIVVTIITLGIVFYSTYLPKLPQFAIPGKNLTTTPVPTLNPKTMPLTILAISVREDYKLTLLNNIGLMDILNKDNIWNKTYKGADQDTKPLKVVIVYLFDKKQTTDYKDQSGNVLFSYSLNFKQDAVIIGVFLPDDVLKSSSATKSFGSAAVYAASKINGVGSAQGNLVQNSTIDNLFQIVNTPVVPRVFPSNLLIPSPTPKR